MPLFRKKGAALSALKVSDTSRHAAVAAEKSILFVEGRLPEMHDLFAIEKANTALKGAREAVLAVDKAIANVVRAAQALDEARASLEAAKKLARDASVTAFASTPVISSDICDSEDLDLGDKVIVQTRYKTYVCEGIVTQLSRDFIWVNEDVLSRDDHIFIMS